MELSNARVLIVDDQPLNIMILADLLRPHYQVLAANSGTRALKTCRASPPPDLVLLDIMMPDMDGYQILDRLRADPATADIPVIFLTAMDASEHEVKGLELGAADYITKPITPPVVLARVRTHLLLKQASDRLKNQNAWLDTEIKPLRSVRPVRRLPLAPPISFPRSL